MNSSLSVRQICFRENIMQIQHHSRPSATKYFIFMTLFMFLEFTVCHHENTKAQGCKKAQTKEDKLMCPGVAKISKPAPRWEGTAVVDGQFKTIRLSDYQGKYLILLFYPLDFTFVCPTEITAFSDRMEDFQAINTEIVACSVDSQFAHIAWISTPRKQGGLGPIKFPLLSDITHQISKDYGVYSDEGGHPLRGLFIIDGKGVLRQITINDPPVGRSVEETLRLIQAFQYTDAHGEVCPAGWKPGSKTIKPEEVLREWWPREEL